MSFILLRIIVIFAMLNFGLNSYGQLPRVAAPEKTKAPACDALAPELFGVKTPYGPGDRTIEICINKCLFTPQDIDVIVFYSKNEAQLDNVSVNPAAPYGHGKAKYVRTVGNILRYEYTFPHSGFKDINGSVASEYKIIEVPSRDISKNAQKLFYRIGVKRSSSNTLFAVAGSASFVIPDPITIAMVGDSFAAGEGAPIQPSTMFTDATQLWNDSDGETTTDVVCHRSYLSGQARAVKKVREENKKLAFAVKHVACSGATVSEMAMQNQKAGSVELPLQFTLIKTWLEKNGFSELDILLMGIGGNDVGFAQAIVDFMLNPFGNFSSDEDAKRRFSSPAHGEYPFNDLKESYSQLNNDIQGGTSFSMSVVGTPIIIQGYPSPCKGPDGSPWCGQEADWLLGVNNTVGDCWGAIEQDDKPAEFKDIHNIIAVNLNKAIEEAAQENGWRYVNLLNRAGNHGLSNCSQPYFNTLGQSISHQGDHSGMIHPNSNGYLNMYVPPLSEAIKKQITDIRSYWDSFDEQDCTANERARIVAEKQLAVEKAKRLARAKSLKKSYPVIRSYSVYRNRYSKQVDQAVLNFSKDLKDGKIKLVSRPAP